MRNRGKIFLATLILIMFGIIIKITIPEYDVRGFSLSEREAFLANAGGNHHFIFELGAGNYEFKLYRFQKGELIEEHVFPAGGVVIGDRNPEGLQVYNPRNLVSITATNIETETWAWSIGSEGFNLGNGIEVTEVERLSRSSESLNTRLQLKDSEIPLAYMAFTEGSFPTALQSIVSGQFDVHEKGDQFVEINDLFIITVRRIY